MRATNLVLLFLATVVAFPTSALCVDPDWALLDENQESGFFYDRNGTSRVREGMIRVRTRIIYTESGKKEALKVLKGLPEPARLFESRYMYEIDCAEKEGRLVAATHFDKNGSILKSTDLESVTFPEYLPPDTRMGIVANEACSR